MNFSKMIIDSKSIIIGLIILLIILALGIVLIEGFGSYMNIRSMLLLAAFLGFAVIGQTLVALLGGLDLSIPFVIGSANILLASLFNTNIEPLISLQSRQKHEALAWLSYVG